MMALAFASGLLVGMGATVVGSVLIVRHRTKRRAKQFEAAADELRRAFGLLIVHPYLDCPCRSCTEQRRRGLNRN